MTILVTGACGFIGKHLVRHLLEAGESVVASDLASCAAHFDDHPRLIWSPCDIVNAKALHNVFEQYQPQAVVHLAYLLPPRSEENPAHTLQTNLLGFENILRAAASLATTPSFVWSSSMAVYGPSGRYETQPVAEDVATYPTSLYGATKVMAEALARHYAAHTTLKPVGFRANLVYGPGRVRGLGNFKIWSRDMFFAAHRGEIQEVPAADQALDWIYVTDVVRAISLMLASENTHSLIFNILGDRRTVRDAVEIIQQQRPEAELKLQAGKLPPEQQPPSFDGTLAVTELGYRPAYSLERGITQYLEFIQDAEKSL